MVAKEIGIDLFDDTTYEPERLMYWPSTSRNGIFVYEEKDGSLLDPDVFLNKYDDWRDTSTWPVSSRQSEILDRSLKEQADPLSKEGVIGTFCRTYSVSTAIDTFLKDIYEPSRLILVPVSSSMMISLPIPTTQQILQVGDCLMLLTLFVFISLVI
jgi:hypothetical protein